MLSGHCASSVMPDEKDRRATKESSSSTSFRFRVSEFRSSDQSGWKEIRRVLSSRDAVAEQIPQRKKRRFRMIKKKNSKLLSYE